MTPHAFVLSSRLGLLLVLVAPTGCGDAGDSTTSNRPGAGAGGNTAAGGASGTAPGIAGSGVTLSGAGANTAGGSGAGVPGSVGGHPGGGGAGGMSAGGVSAGGGVSGDPSRLELVHASFTQATPGPYAQASVAADFGGTPAWNNGLDQGRAIIANEGGNQFLRVTYPANQFGPTAGGVQFKVPLDRTYTELFFAFKVRFQAGFNFVRGGKLPGLVGGTSPSGCAADVGGFAARNMWRTGGDAVQYVYWPSQPNPCGDDLKYNVNGVAQVFKPGAWQTIEHHVKMNTKGVADGVLEAWLNGVPVLADSARVWRDASHDYGIDALYFSTFFGGADPSWAPATAQVADFDELIVADKPITH